jgi:outer membrane protein insertion porin family
VLRLAYDTRDDIFEPTQGWYLAGTQELAGGLLGGTKDFWRSYAEANYFKTVWRDSSEWKRPHVLTFRVEGDTAGAYGRTDKVPLSERWFAGGIGSLRGFEYHTIGPRDDAGEVVGGDTMTTASLEYFFPLFGKFFRGSVFYDMGNVWGDDNDGKSGWRSSTGVGLHFQTPLGPVPIRIYYAVPVQKERGDTTQSVQFTLGAVF